MKQVSPYTYEIDIDGSLHRYNQRNMKPSPPPNYDDTDTAFDAAADGAYDSVMEPNEPAEESNDRQISRDGTSMACPVNNKRYNLRKKSVDPRLYRC